MSASEAPKFQWGQPVWTAVDLLNDGSYPNSPEDALLVATGDRGEILQIGAHVDSKNIVYLVEFSENRVIGCLEDEIVAIPPVVSNESKSP
jgi:nitrogen fixation protein NifZ